MTKAISDYLIDHHVINRQSDEISFYLRTGFVMTDAKASQDLRQAIVRYAMLAYVLCIRRFSTNLQRHLPTLQSIQDLGNLV